MDNDKQPNKHIMALITFLALVPLVYFIPELIKSALPANKLLNVTVTVGVIVPIVSYIVMPIVLKIIKPSS